MKHLLAILILVSTAGFSRAQLDYARGTPIPTGDLAVQLDVPQGQSYTIRGSGGGRSGKSSNGTQLVPVKPDQPFIVRIGEAPRGGTALGSSIRDVSFWGATKDPWYQGDGLVLRSWGGLTLDNVGFHGCKRGLVLDITQKGTGLTARKLWFANNKTGAYIDLSKYANRVVNRLDGWYVNGNGVGIEVADPGPKALVIRDLYAENNHCSVLQRSGVVVYEGCYMEGNPADLNGDGKQDLTPAIAVLEGKAILRDMENANYIYFSKKATFEADAASNIGYLVMDADDPRLAQVVREWPPKPGYRFRVLVVPEGYDRGKFLQWRNVSPN